MQEKTEVDISIVLPTYNERDNIVDFICEIDFYLSRYIKKTTEFIIIDDDSEDKTWEAVQGYFVSDQRIRVVRRINERGLASAIWQGVNLARGDIIAWLDCDFSMPPYKLVELAQKVYDGYDLAVGSRFIKGGKDIRGSADSWLATILSRLMNYFISFTLGNSFKDYTSGFVAVKRKVFEAGIKIRGDYGEYFIDFIYNVRKCGYKIIEVPYYCLPRRKGSSKTGDNLMDYLKKGWKYILLTLRLRLKG